MDSLRLAERVLLALSRDHLAVVLNGPLRTTPVSLSLTLSLGSLIHVIAVRHLSPASMFIIKLFSLPRPRVLFDRRFFSHARPLVILIVDSLKHPPTPRLGDFVEA